MSSRNTLKFIPKTLEENRIKVVTIRDIFITIISFCVFIIFSLIVAIILPLFKNRRSRRNNNIVDRVSSFGNNQLTLDQIEFIYNDIFKKYKAENEYLREKIQTCQKQSLQVVEIAKKLEKNIEVLEADKVHLQDEVKELYKTIKESTDELVKFRKSKKSSNNNIKDLNEQLRKKENQLKNITENIRKCIHEFENKMKKIGVKPTKTNNLSFGMQGLYRYNLSDNKLSFSYIYACILLIVFIILYSIVISKTNDFISKIENYLNLQRQQRNLLDSLDDDQNEFKKLIIGVSIFSFLFTLFSMLFMIPRRWYTDDRIDDSKYKVIFLFMIGIYFVLLLSAVGISTNLEKL